MSAASDLVPGARYVVVPDGIVSTAWPRVRGTCRKIGWRFDPWQDATGRLVLAKKANGSWAADLSILSIPRQVGKTYFYGATLFALCLLTPGLRAIWTSHHTATTEEVFEAMKEMGGHPKVRPHVTKCVALQGSRWRIQFANKARIDFGARSQGFGRGKSKVGVLVLDEFQHITSRALANLAPTANTADNPLVLCAGTPPGPEVQGEAFTMRRMAALEGLSTDTLYIEFSADSDADPDDRRQWAKANPSFPKRTPERNILLLRKLFEEDDFRREALGIWDDVSAHEAIVPDGVWRKLQDIGPDRDEAPTALGVDMSYRGEISIAGCWLRNGSRPHLEEVWSGVNVDECVSWLVENGRGIDILVDASAPAAQMVPLLKAERMKVSRVGQGQLADGCVLFETMANGEQLTHAGQSSLTKALRGACKRPVQDAGKWRPDRKDSTASIFPFVAAVLALLGACSIGDQSDAFFL